MSALLALVCLWGQAAKAQTFLPYGSGMPLPAEQELHILDNFHIWGLVFNSTNYVPVYYTLGLHSSQNGDFQFLLKGRPSKGILIWFYVDQLDPEMRQVHLKPEEIKIFSGHNTTGLNYEDHAFTRARIVVVKFLLDEEIPPTTAPSTSDDLKIKSGANSITNLPVSPVKLDSEKFTDDGIAALRDLESSPTFHSSAYPQALDLGQKAIQKMLAAASQAQDFAASIREVQRQAQDIRGGYAPELNGVTIDLPQVLRGELANLVYNNLSTVSADQRDIEGLTENPLRDAMISSSFQAQTKEHLTQFFGYLATYKSRLYFSFRLFSSGINPLWDLYQKKAETKVTFGEADADYRVIIRENFNRDNEDGFHSMNYRGYIAALFAKVGVLNALADAMTSEGYPNDAVGKVLYCAILNAQMIHAGTPPYLFQMDDTKDFNGDVQKRDQLIGQLNQKLAEVRESPEQAIARIQEQIRPLTDQWRQKLEETEDRMRDVLTAFGAARGLLTNSWAAESASLVKNQEEKRRLAETVEQTGTNDVYKRQAEALRADIRRMEIELGRIVDSHKKEQADWVKYESAARQQFQNVAGLVAAVDKPPEWNLVEFEGSSGNPDSWIPVADRSPGGHPALADILEGQNSPPPSQAPNPSQSSSADDSKTGLLNLLEGKSKP